MIFDLISPLSREECVQRLRMKADPAWSGTVIGSVGQTSFRLRKRIGYRNSFQYSLSGKMIDDNGGTRLHCRIGLHPFVLVFLAFWFGVVLIGCGMVSVQTVSALARGAPLVGLWPGAAIPFLMLAAAAALVLFGRHLGRGEPGFLIDVVRQTLDAR
jgi:hypothetical protein